MKKIFLVLGYCLLLTTSSVVVANTMYKCTDSSGVPVYTNEKNSRKGCVILSQTPSAPTADPAHTYSNVSSGSGTILSSGGTKPKASSTPSPGDFPRVSSNEQKARDTDRRVILDKELSNEQQNLDKAKKAIAEAGIQPPEKLKAYRDTAALHERNVEALKKELSNLR